MSASLYEQIGGEVAVMAAVKLFYDKVIADPIVGEFFQDLDMDAQVTKQMAFLTRALGGPDKYHGRDLREAHAKLVGRGLTDVHFDTVVGHLRTTLAELGVGANEISAVTDIVESTRGEVLGR